MLSVGWPVVMQIVDNKCMGMTKAIGPLVRVLQVWMIRWQVGVRMHQAVGALVRPEFEANRNCTACDQAEHNERGWDAEACPDPSGERVRKQPARMG